MKTPICTFDAKAAILCTKCETKLRLGHLTHADVDGAIKISRIAEHNQDVSKFTMVRASQVDDDFILGLHSSDISVLRTNLSLIKKFEDEFRRKVWFVEAESTDKRFIENLFFPAKVLMFNLIWLPDGSKSTRVIISTLSKPELQLNVEKIKKIAKEIRNIELLVEFEHQK